MLRRIVGICCVAIATMIWVACGFGSEEGALFSSSDSYGGDGGDSRSSYPGESATGTGIEIEAGQLTAADWDDNLNFSLFREYVDWYSGQYAGAPVIESGDRIVVTVQNGWGLPVSNAWVEICDDRQACLSAPTASDGRLLFFPEHDGVSVADWYFVTAEAPSDAGSGDRVTVKASGEESEWSIVLPYAGATVPGSLDLAFVVDTTGSMSDELSYLQAEIRGILEVVHEQMSGVSVRYALVAYRDNGDDFVAQKFDFTSNVEALQSTLDGYRADGGGDYPEAVDRAVVLMNQLDWRSGNVARVAFLVGDAPPHSERAQAFLNEVNRSRLAGIKIYPVAASGVGDEAEYLWRVAAQATLARYIFLTDDSGYGNPHEEPHVPCYLVQYLNKILVRMLLSELSGAHVSPDPDDVIRAEGDPQDGVCTLGDGMEAFL